MQYSQEHLKTMVYAKFGGQTECIMGNWKIENKRPCQQKYTLSRHTEFWFFDHGKLTIQQIQKYGYMVTV